MVTRKASVSFKAAPVRDRRRRNDVHNFSVKLVTTVSFLKSSSGTMT